MYTVETKFLGACTFTDEFDNFDKAVRYVQQELERLKCFYKGLSRDRPFSIDQKPTRRGMVITMGLENMYTNRWNLYVVYSIREKEDGATFQDKGEGTSAGT